jgi:hypothetical protein
MLLKTLELLLWFVSFILPLSAGFRLCRKSNPPPADVSNIVSTFALLWTAELLDQLIFSSLIATRELFIVARILLALYLVHPQFQGGLTIHKAVIEEFVGLYGNQVDEALTEHLHELRKNGAVVYLGRAAVQGTVLLGSGLSIVKALMAPSAHQATPEASPERTSGKDD